MVLLLSSVNQGNSQIKTLTGFAVNDLNVPLQNALAEMYLMPQDSLVASDDITNGAFSLSFNATGVNDLLLQITEIAMTGANPYNDFTRIRFTNAKNQPAQITVCNLAGQMIAISGQCDLEAGSYELLIRGGKGIQIVAIKTPEATLVRKLIADTPDKSVAAELRPLSIEPRILKSTAGNIYRVVIRSDEVNTLEQTINQFNENFTLSTPANPTVTTRRSTLNLRAVKLEDLKANDGHNIPVTEIPGIQGLRVFLKSQLNNSQNNVDNISYTTGANGEVTVRLPDGATGTTFNDTLVITNTKTNETYYNFVKAINTTLQPGENKVHRHLWNQQGNEPVPMITRYTDENGRDMVEYLERIMTISDVSNPGSRFWHTTRRLKDEPNGRTLWKIYLNRPDQKASWQAPLAWTRLNIVRDTINYLAGKTLIDITEVQSKEEATCYINTWKAEASGQVIEILYNEENGLNYNTRNGINMGTQGETQTIYKRYMQYVLLQEFGHTLNLTGEHGDFLDMTRADAGKRLERNDPLTPSVLEAKVWITNIYQPLCWRPEEYSRDYLPSIKYK
ncbi:MAG: hypothetical protein NTV01_15385 [Bacteroidia bacterium]|nr:hypothetical protein [Bacteroidia bacterium]